MQSELCTMVLGAGVLRSPNTPIVGKTRHPLLMVTTLSMELFQQSSLEDPGNHVKALKPVLKHQAGIKVCLSACTCRCFSAQSNTGVTQSKVFWHISIIMCGVFFFVHFFLLCFSEIYNCQGSSVMLRWCVPSCEWYGLGPTYCLTTEEPLFSSSLLLQSSHQDTAVGFVVSWWGGKPKYMYFTSIK